MKKCVIWLSVIVLTLNLAVFISGQEEEEEPFDISKNSCQDLQIAFEEDDHATLSIHLFWLSGYASAIQGKSVPIDEQFREKMKAKALNFCEQNPSANLFEVSVAILPKKEAS